MIEWKKMIPTTAENMFMTIVTHEGDDNGKLLFLTTRCNYEIEERNNF